MTYTPFSQSVIHVSLNQDIADSLSISARVQTNIPVGGNESNTVTMSKTGDYYLNLEIDRPAKSFLSLGDSQYNVFVFPQDTTHLKVHISQNRIELNFYGKAKTINEYYLKKRKDLGYTDIRYPLNEPLSARTTYKLLKQTTDSVINRELAFFEAYASTARLPEWFLNYEEAEIIYMGAGYKTAMPQANKILKYFRDSIPSDYYDFLKHIRIDNPKAVLSSQYFYFLDEYFLKSLPVNETNRLSGFARVNKMMPHKLGQSKDQLSGETRDLYHKYNFSTLIKYYTDSTAIDSLARELQLSDYKELVRLAGSRSRSEIQKLNLTKGDTIPDFVLSNALDSLISIRGFQDHVLYINFWATWCGPCIQNITELNKLISQYEEDPKIKFLNICLDDEWEKWLAGISRHKIKGVNLFAQGKWNSKLRSYFNIEGIPHYVIINKGNILFENATDKAPKVQEKIRDILTGK